MIRVLHIVPNMNSGGLETFIMNVYRNIDRNKFQFDFLEHYQEKSFYDSEIQSLGGKIYHFSLRDDNNIFKYIIKINKFFKNHNEYKVIHCHMESIGSLVFIIAKIHGIKIRIGHAHTNSFNKNLKGYVKRFLSLFFKYTTTINFACSNEAGRYLFKNKKYIVIPNGINFQKFKFNKNKRIKLRKEYNLEDKFVIGHVGRMDDSKNQLFLIDVFNQYQKFNNNSMLILVGDGEFKNKILKKISKLNIENKVLLLGIRNDVNDLLSMFDVFAFPSKFEGLGICLIEAQINGLMTLTSENIPKNTNISNYIKYLPLEVNKWVTALKNVNKRDNKIVYNEEMKKYNIESVVDILKKTYEKGV